MAGMFPLSVKISQRAPVCILDARLALAPGGLLLALKLARATELWLTREFWSLIDSVFVFARAHPPAAMRELWLWHTAWLAGRLQGAFHWIGDARRESVLPEGADPDLLAQFEQLDAALLEAMTAHNGSLEGLLSDCARQSIALAAALGPQAPIILTLAGNHGGQEPPPLLADATSLGLKTVREVTNQEEIALLSDGLCQPPGRAALTQARLAGPPLLAVHLIAHNAVALAPAQDCIDPAEDELDALPACSPWQDALLYWHRLA
jgi:hypothetical protein